LHLHALHYMLSSLTGSFALDPAEPEPDELQEPASVEATNPEQNQDKPQCI
jgi:hypothetical protein